MNAVLFTTPIQSQERAGNKQPKILVLEENPALRELLRWVFIVGGYHYCRTMHETIQNQSLAHIDFILLDIDGSRTWENTVVSSLWEQEKTPPLLILTCHPQRIVTVKQLGVQVLQKPFHVHDLLQAVASAREQQTPPSLVEEGPVDSLDISSQLERFHHLSHFD